MEKSISYKLETFEGPLDLLLHLIEKDKIDIPDYVEITADATDFELGMTVTVATNEIVNRIEQITA